MSSSTSVPPRPGSAQAKQAAKQQQHSKQSVPAFKKQAKHDGRGGGTSNPFANPWVIGGIIAAIVAVVGIISIVSATDSPADTDALSQVRPVAVTGTPLPVLGDDGSDSALGSVAPTVTGSSFDGSPVALDPSRPTLLVFVAHWCPHCQAEVPRLVQWNNAGDVPAGVDIVGIATSTDSKQNNYPPSDWLVSEGFPWPVLADSEASEAAAAMGVDAFPYFVLLDGDGAVQWRTSGEVSTEVLAEQIQAVLDR